MARDFVRASSQYLEVTTGIATATPLTIACWANLDDNTNSQDLVSVCRKTSTQQAFRLNAGGNAAGDPIRAVTTNNATNGIAVTSVGYSLGVWTHCAATFTSSTSRKAYINGSGGTADTTSVTPSGIDRTMIGAIWSNSVIANATDGRLAEVGIWTVVLSDAEILALAKGANPATIRPDKLIGYWPVWGQSSPEPDLSVGSHNMAVTGATLDTSHAPVGRYVPAPKYWPISVASGLSAVSNTSSHLFNIIAQISQTSTHKFNIAETVSQTSTHLFNIITQVAQTSSHLFNIREVISNTSTHKFNIAEIVAQTSTHIFNILSSLTAVSNTLTSLFHIRQEVAQTSTHKFNILAQIAQISTHIFNILSSATTVIATVKVRALRSTVKVQSLRNTLKTKILRHTVKSKELNPDD